MFVKRKLDLFDFIIEIDDSVINFLLRGHSSGFFCYCYLIITVDKFYGWKITRVMVVFAATEPTTSF